LHIHLATDAFETTSTRKEELLNVYCPSRDKNEQPNMEIKYG